LTEFALSTILDLSLSGDLPSKRKAANRMADKKKSPSPAKQNVSGDKNIVIGGDLNGVVISGDNNTVNQTIVQKFFNIFKSDSETLEQRNRLTLLGHVANAWIKGLNHD
jgi:hypothetical protein